MVIGWLGRSWTARSRVRDDLTAASFAERPPADRALAGWNLVVTPLPGGRRELRTETRVRCAPDALLW